MIRRLLFYISVVVLAVSLTALRLCLSERLPAGNVVLIVILASLWAWLTGQKMFGEGYD